MSRSSACIPSSATATPPTNNGSKSVTASFRRPWHSKYGIVGPLCLYTERNLFMLLLEAGASVLRTMTSTYGNVKGVAVRV